MRRLATFFLVLAMAFLVAGNARPAEAPSLTLQLIGAPQTVFTPARDACDGNDVPDAPVRAFRDASGGVVMFGLHYVNRAFRGPDLSHLKLDCHVALDSHLDADPAHYDDHSWITALWTTDGRAVEALVHHEFHASEHKGRCVFPAYMQCWYNTIIGLQSADGGANFPRATPPPVVAAVPFRSDFDQGRHRGFFNPSNIFTKDGYEYFFASTTGWAGQAGGVCLFRTDNPANPGSWRAWDGQGYTAAFPDPYRATTKLSSHCAIVAPFQAPVGAVVRRRGSGVFLAVFQAWRAGVQFPLPGFYYATSRDLLNWSLPRLLAAGPTLYDDPCKSGGRLIAYPSLLDEKAESRVFEDVGDEAWLYYATLKVEGCAVTSQRDLLRVGIRIAAAP